MCANVQTFYVRATVKPGDSVPYGDLEQSEIVTWYEDGEPYFPGSGVCRSVRCSGKGTPLTIIRYTECGDYSSNALVGESNLRVLRERFPWLVEIYGSHGYRALGYLGKRETQNPELIEALDALDRYPLADEDDHSELERETESAAWSDDGIKDFRRSLTSVLDRLDPDFEDMHDLDAIPDEQLTEVWYAGCEAFNVNGGSGYVNEQGDSIHFYIGDWCKHAAPTRHDPAFYWIARSQIEAPPIEGSETDPQRAIEAYSTAFDLDGRSRTDWSRNARLGLQRTLYTLAIKSRTE